MVQKKANYEGIYMFGEVYLDFNKGRKKWSTW